MNKPRLGNYRNSEFLQYLKDVLELVNQYDVQLLGVTEQRNALATSTAALDAVFQHDQSNKVTQVLLDLDTKRGSMYSGIKSILEGNTHHFDLVKQEAAKRLLFNFTSYGKNVTRMNYQAETATIDSMLADWNTDPTMQEAVVLLQLSEWVVELQRINTLFNERYLASISETAANPRISFSTLRNDGIVAYRALVARIKAFMTLEANEAYTQVYSEIYELARQYNQVVKFRQTK
ncbi:hypothetical protein H2O64_09180 [Kordia sp. YSTF-M3]|uniref:Uncharacterized protein n=1 Tax=Kordia aestuariivivens TaxID=2759037 RepID=A0ABR7Q8F4_9FLAO|nr:DUF6261 family protein [Kordia aestuariivivens]MBC8754841.1 hypothetical protein [Kordia aestuariivivens]